MQARWFDEGMDNSQTMSLRALTIFETASETEQPGSKFVNLLQASNMAPLDGDLGLLKGSDLIIPGSKHEAAVMEDRLGVTMLSHANLLEEHVIPRCVKLASERKRALNKTSVAFTWTKTTARCHDSTFQ